MGTYIYRVTAKTVICPDGQKANVYKFAYKPYYGWEGDKLNRKLHFKSGAASSDRMAALGKLTARVVFEDESGKIHWGCCYENPEALGHFYDHTSGTSALPRVKFAATEQAIAAARAAEMQKIQEARAAELDAQIRARSDELAKLIAARQAMQNA